MIFKSLLYESFGQILLLEKDRKTGPNPNKLIKKLETQKAWKGEDCADSIEGWSVAWTYAIDQD